MNTNIYTINYTIFLLKLNIKNYFKILNIPYILPFKEKFYYIELSQKEIKIIWKTQILLFGRKENFFLTIKFDILKMKILKITKIILLKRKYI